MLGCTTNRARKKNKNFQKSRAYLFKILYNGIVEKP